MIKTLSKAQKIQNIKRVIRKYNGTYLVKKEDVYKLMISFPLDVGNVKI